MSRLLPAGLALALLLSLATGCPGESQPRHLLFDQGHGQRFTIEQEGDLQLGRFAETLRGEGLEVASTTEPITPELLAGVDALVISGPFKAYSPAEGKAVKAWVEGGGRLAIMLHIAQPVWGVLGDLGVEVANGVVRDPKHQLDEKAINFRVPDLTQHPLNAGLESFNLYGGWPLRPASEKAQVLAFTDAGAWVDLDRDQKLGQGDAVQSFGVVVGGELGQGAFVVFADDAIFQNRFLVDENLKLAKNLGAFLGAR
ncbi:MAG: DUF4350 domain-containing protein [Deltaproteobacteria bacterium]|nr:DUF4350 domain-containing protein [Deltaproteobacteria bacterium]